MHRPSYRCSAFTYGLGARGSLNPDSWREPYNAVVDPRQLELIADRYGIVLMVQFGSSVTGRTHAQSDCDVGVLFERAPESFGVLADVVAELQALSPGRDVDVAVLNHADPLLLKQVMAQGLRLHGSQRRFQALQLLAFKRYQDHRRYLVLERDYVERKTAGVVP